VTRPWFNAPFIIAASRCEYIHPITEPGSVGVELWTGHIGDYSWDLEYEIRDPANAKAAIGRTTQVQFDYSSKRSMKIHQKLLAQLKAHRKPPSDFGDVLNGPRYDYENKN
jgi:acyl-CoA thioesterase FadM